MRDTTVAAIVCSGIGLCFAAAALLASSPINAPPSFALPLPTATPMLGDHVGALQPFTWHGAGVNLSCVSDHNAQILEPMAEADYPTPTVDPNGLTNGYLHNYGYGPAGP